MKRLFITLLFVVCGVVGLDAQTGQGFWWPRKTIPRSGVTFSGNWSLSGTARTRVAFVIQCPKDGTIDQVEFYVGFVSSPSSVRVSFQDVDASDTPDGTQDQYRDVASPTAIWIVPGLMTSDGTDGGVKRSCTKGDKFAIVWEWTSTQSGEVWLYAISDNTNASRGWPPSWVHNGTSYSVTGVSTLFYNIALKYNDGSYAPIQRAWPASTSLATATVSTSTTPDEVGNLITVDTALVVDGACARVGVTGAFQFIIYDTSDVEQVNVTVPASTDGGTDSCFWFDDVSLAAADYRTIIKPTTTTSLTVGYATVNTSAHRAALPSGLGQFTSRTDAGAWSQTDTQQAEIVLHVASITGGGSGGGGSYPFIGGVVAVLGSFFLVLWRRA